MTGVFVYLTGVLVRVGQKVLKRTHCPTFWTGVLVYLTGALVYFVRGFAPEPWSNQMTN